MPVLRFLTARHLTLQLNVCWDEVACCSFCSSILRTAGFPERTIRTLPHWTMFRYRTSLHLANTNWLQNTPCIWSEWPNLPIPIISHTKAWMCPCPDVRGWMCVSGLNISLSHHPEQSKWTAQLRQRNGFKCPGSAHTACYVTTRIDSHSLDNLWHLWKLLTTNRHKLFSVIVLITLMSRPHFSDQFGVT